MRTISYMPTYDLIPHERISYIRAVWLLYKMMVEQEFSKPLLVDAHSNVILDGHHRWTVSKWLRLKRIPCHCVDYLNDDGITVLPRRKHIPVDKRAVLDTALRGYTFPRKTTRHVHTVPPENVRPTVLSLLRRDA